MDRRRTRLHGRTIHKGDNMERQHGFDLIELMIVVATIALAAVLVSNIIDPPKMVYSTRYTMSCTRNGALLFEHSWMQHENPPTYTPEPGSFCKTTSATETIVNPNWTKRYKTRKGD